jgi:hypothetical protein
VFFSGIGGEGIFILRVPFAVLLHAQLTARVEAIYRLVFFHEVAAPNDGQATLTRRKSTREKFVKERKSVIFRRPRGVCYSLAALGSAGNGVADRLGASWGCSLAGNGHLRLPAAGKGQDGGPTALLVEIMANGSP